MFQKGNKLGAKKGLFADTIKRALAQDDKDRMRKGIEMLLDAFAAGDHKAAEMLRDTLDGKPTQSIDANVNTNLTIGTIREFEP
jgi:hypothetical protein